MPSVRPQLLWDTSHIWPGPELSCALAGAWKTQPLLEGDSAGATGLRLRTVPTGASNRETRSGLCARPGCSCVCTPAFPASCCSVMALGATPQGGWAVAWKGEHPCSRKTQEPQQTTAPKRGHRQPRKPPSASHLLPEPRQVTHPL